MQSYIRSIGTRYYIIQDGRAIYYDKYLDAAKALLTPKQPVVTPSYKGLMTSDNSEIPPYLSDEQKAIWTKTYERVLKSTGDTVKAWLAAMGMVRRQLSNLAVKSTVASEADVRIGGWMILFGSPAFKDKVDTYFTADTDYMLDAFPTAPLFYHHGFDPVYKGTVIGIRENAVVYPEIGIWGEHRLYANHPLFKRTYSELSEGLLAYSSDTFAHFANLGLTQDGGLTIWGLAGCSLTKTPAEPGLGIVVQLDEMSEAA